MLPARLLARGTALVARCHAAATPLRARPASRLLHGSDRVPQSHDDSIPDPSPDAGFEFGRIGLLGGGKMAEAIIEGFLTEKLIEPEKISVYDVNKGRLDYLKKEFGVYASSSLTATCKKAGR